MRSRENLGPRAFDFFVPLLEFLGKSFNSQVVMVLLARKRSRKLLSKLFRSLRPEPLIHDSHSTIGEFNLTFLFLLGVGLIEIVEEDFHLLLFNLLTIFFGPKFISFVDLADTLRHRRSDKLGV